MRRFRFVIRVAAVIVMLTLVAFAGGLAALNSQSFARWLLNEVAQRSDGAVRIESVSGTLGGDLNIDQVFVDFGSGTATAFSVALQLDWRSLIARSIVLNYLDVSRIEVALDGADAQIADTQPAETSLLVLLREIAIDEIEVAATDAEYLLSDVGLELRLLRNHLELNALSALYDDMRLSGNAALTLADQSVLNATVCADGVLMEERVLGCGEIDGSLNSLRVDAQLQAPFMLTATGTLEPSDELTMDLEVTWQEAVLSALPDFFSQSGTATLSGTLDRLRMTVEGSIAYLDEAGEVSAEVVVDSSGIEIEQLQLSQGAAAAELSGAVTREFDAAELALIARGVDPQRWLADWPGSLDVRAQVAVGTDPSLHVTVSDILINGNVRDYPLAATGALLYADQALTIDSAQVVSRTDQITVSGRIAETLDLDVAVDLADVGFALPEATGALTAELEVTGTMDQPLATGRVGLTDFSMDVFYARELQLAGAAGIAASDPFELALSAQGVTVVDTPLSSTVVSVSGTAAAHRLEARVIGEQWSAVLASDGALLDRSWSGRLDQFEFAPGEFGVWQLGPPADLRYGPGAYSISDLCLSYTLSRICVAVDVAGEIDDTLRVTAENFDVGILEVFLPPGIAARGLIDARGEISNFIADPRGEVEFAAADAQVDIEIAEGVVLPVPIEQLSLAALLDDSGATVSASLSAAELGYATAALALGNPRLPDSPLQGTVNIQWRDAAVLGLLSPDVEDVAGQIDAVFTLGGTIAAPAPGGTAAWTNGSLTVPAWALVVDDIAASIDASRGNEALFEAQGAVDGTPVNIDGTVLLDQEQGWPMQFRLSGEDLSLVQLTDMEIHVSPQLEASVRLPRIEVGGTVRIPTAHIRDVALPQQAVVPSQDTIVYGRETNERVRPVDVIAALTLELGEDVTYQDANLNASVTGRLDLDYRSGEGSAAEGALTLSGEYDAYGNPLALERGQLIFVGPLDDPSLDIRAVRRYETVTAGVQLTGTLQAPVTTLFSEPAMSEADALSWLLFGRPVDDVRESESGALRSAALSMGLQQALPVIERIGETLRLDDFAIRNTETDAGALMAGKYLSPNLYFRYSYGLFNRIGGLLLRYRINDRFSLETRSGEHKSMDFLYTVEKD